MSYYNTMHVNPNNSTKEEEEEIVECIYCNIPGKQNRKQLNRNQNLYNIIKCWYAVLHLTLVMEDSTIKNKKSSKSA